MRRKLPLRLASSSGTAQISQNRSTKTRIRPRPGYLPYAWVRVTPKSGIQNQWQKRDWQLVLQARGIPCIISSFQGREHLYAPALQAGLARYELECYILENGRPKRSAPDQAPWREGWLASFLILPFWLVYGFQHGWWRPPGFLPPPEAWFDLGRLDAFLVLANHEWYRTITALFLHADSSHLAGNSFFGALFLAMLGRQAGIGKTALLTVCAGGIANAASVIFHMRAYASIGYSTGLFATVGILAAYNLVRSGWKRRLPMSVAAAVAILALLGTNGENTDYGAHIAGLGVGLGLGLLAGAHRSTHMWEQYASAIFAFAMVICAWLMAFCQYSH